MIGYKRFFYTNGFSIFDLPSLSIIVDFYLLADMGPID